MVGDAQTQLPRSVLGLSAALLPLSNKVTEFELCDYSPCSPASAGKAGKTATVKRLLRQMTVKRRIRSQSAGYQRQPQPHQTEK